ncbi:MULTISPECIES: hypothetical protein [unclassified Streptomyces]|uniref:hypothetical protein n=1 Tax=unclassified Streptomyces TaxID=2593676 RepID=UPI0035DDD495
MTKHSVTSTFGRKLAQVVLGLTALVTLTLCAFALPPIHSGPHHVPIEVTGPPKFTEAFQENLDRQAWDVRQYETFAAVKSAVESRDIDGGLAITAQGVDVYTATAGGPSATGAITELGNRVAAEQGARADVHDLVPFTEDDPRGAGLTAALLPMIFGGMFPALFLNAVFPGHRGLRTRLAGALLFSLPTGAAVAAFLQFVTESVDGDYVLTALGLVLGLTALSTTLIGLQACLGVAGLALGGALVMLLGNPLSGLATGPHWLPSGWSTLGQLLPPGAAGSLLRANAFFDGQGGGLPALVLTAWVVAGVSMVLVADRQGRTKPSHAAGGRYVPALP